MVYPSFLVDYYFCFLIFSNKKIVFPRLSDSIEQRNEHISDNIDQANSIKNQAEEKYQEYLKLLSDAKKEAQDLINNNKKVLLNNFENKKRN